MDKNLSFKFTVTYSVDKENLAFEDMSMKVKIAGINYHLDKNDGDYFGLLAGYIENEPDNPVDSSALGIYANDGKLVGYIPKSEIAKVNKFTEGEMMPCFLQIAPFVDNEGKVAMQGTAVLLKLYEGKEDMMQKVINDYTVSLGEASKEQLGELNGKLDKTKYNEYVENGEGLLDQFGFNILPYEILPSSEKTKDWSLDVSHFYIEDVNRYLNVVFIEPEEMGLFSGYMLNDGIYSSDGDLIGHVPDSVLSQTNEMSKGRKLFCLYFIYQKLNSANQLCLASRVIAFKLYEDEGDYNLALVGNFGYDFVKDTINELKESQKQIDKLKQHGKKLDTSNEYYDFRKKKIDKPVGCSNNAHEKPQEKAGCMSMLIIFVIFTGTLLLAIL